VFTYMIIHDLKHPTESLINTLVFLLKQLDSELEQLNFIKSHLKNKKAELMQEDHLKFLQLVEKSL
jgi:hypothetical protein